MKRVLLPVTAVAAVTLVGFGLQKAGAYSFIGDKWQNPIFPVPYVFNTTLDEACITGDDEDEEVRQAFLTWEAVTGTTMSFQDVPGNGAACGLVVDGQNTISMEDCLNQCTGSCIAVTSSIDWGGGGDPTWAFDGGTPRQLRGKMESDITFSKSWRFGTLADVGSGCMSDACPAGNTFDIRGIAVHEIGHFIGLGHSSVPGSTMFASASACNVGLSSLHSDDMAGGRVLYDSNYVPFDYGDVTGGNVKSSILNAGNIGISGSGESVPGQFGSGFQYPIGTQNLYEAALIFGTDGSSSVSSDYRQAGAFGQDNDFFQLTPVTAGGLAADDVKQARYADDRGESGGYGIEVTSTMSAYSSAPNDDFVIVCFTLKNVSGATISNLRVGMLMDWDFNDVFATNSLTWDAVNEVGIISDPSTTRRAGVAVLNAAGTATFRGLTSSDPQSDLNKADYLFSDFTSTDVVNDDVNLLIATGDFTLSAGAETTASFVLAGGTSEADLLTNVAQARSIYDSADFCGTVVGVDEAAVPQGPAQLGQNVPNPFNPRTTISFELERASMVLLDVYSAAGQHVRSLRAGVESPGAHSVVWDGRDDAGMDVPSGMYFYTLKAAGVSQSRKMMLLK